MRSGKNKGGNNGAMKGEEGSVPGGGWVGVGGWVGQQPLRDTASCCLESDFLHVFLLPRLKS